MNFNDYVVQEFRKVSPVIKENMSEAGDTDTFGGSQWMGPHHHKYVIWDNQTGYGYTGDVLVDNPEHKEGLSPCCSHIHLIMNWEVVPLGDMHTHKLLRPEQVAVDTDIGSVPRQVVGVLPYVHPAMQSTVDTSSST